MTLMSSGVSTGMSSKNEVNLRLGAQEVWLRQRIAPEIIAFGGADLLQDRDALFGGPLARLQQQADVVEQRAFLCVGRMIERQDVGAGLGHVDGVDARDDDGSVGRYVACARH